MHIAGKKTRIQNQEPTAKKKENENPRNATGSSWQQSLYEIQPQAETQGWRYQEFDAANGKNYQYF